MKYSIATIGALAWTVTQVHATVAVWGQCGGQNYSGDTTCAAGSTCVYSNPYYSQCLPNSSTTTTTTKTTTTTTTTKTSTSTTSTKTSSTTTTSSKPTSSTTSTTTSKSSTTTSASSTTTTPVTTGACGTIGNPYESGYTTYLSPYYVAEVNAAVASISDATLKTKAAKVAQVPNFTWFDTVAKVPTLSTYLADAQSQSSKSIVQIVIYDLPNRDCHAKASNGEFHIADNGVANYENYIDQISAAITAYPNVRVVAVYEPDSLANLVTNMSDSNCANAHDAYLTCATYALKKLVQCNIWLYQSFTLLS